MSNALAHALPPPSGGHQLETLCARMRPERPATAAELAAAVPAMALLHGPHKREHVVPVALLGRPREGGCVVIVVGGETRRVSAARVEVVRP